MWSCSSLLLGAIVSLLVLGHGFAWLCKAYEVEVSYLGRGDNSLLFVMCWLVDDAVVERTESSGGPQILKDCLLGSLRTNKRQSLAVMSPDRGNFDRPSAASVCSDSRDTCDSYH
jgi:predicted MPP superfamily phosphohydrolase